MSYPGFSPRSSASYDWSASDLGSPAQWPLALRLGADVLFNTPLPGLLVWGLESRVFYNDAYATLAASSQARAPGGSVPPLWPVALAAARDALAQARAGAPVIAAAQMLTFADARPFDLIFTPLALADGSVGGVLCMLSETAAPLLAAAEIGSRGLNILVVEDNLDSQYLVCEMLRAFGHEADGVAHPDDALAHLARQRYDLLFSDVSLPGMSGVDLARQALQDAPGMRVIFASGYGDSMLRHLDFPYLSLQKPYELDQLQEALAKVEQQLHARA